MRRLVPDGAAVELADVYAGLDPTPDGWVALSMVTSVDGAYSVGGSTDQLGGVADLAAFRATRALADVVVAASGTVQAEDYRPTWTPRHVAARRRRGQEPLPRLAVVTGSGRMDPAARVFGDPDAPPLVLTTADGADELRSRDIDAEVVPLPSTGSGVDPRASVAALHQRGLRRVVCEGGPTLNASWLEAGVVDELLVTVAPLLVGTEGSGIAGVLDGNPVPLTLHEVRSHGSELVLRYHVHTRRYGPDGAADR